MGERSGTVVAEQVLKLFFQLLDWGRLLGFPTV